MLRKILLLVTGMVLVMATGILWGGWFTLGKSMYTFTPEVFVAIGKPLTQQGVSMVVLLSLGVMGIGALMLMAGKRKKLHFYWLLATLVLFAVALVITLTKQLPLDDQINKFTAGNMPSGWKDIRDRWQSWNTNRAFITLTGIACYFVAVIKRYS